MSNDKAQAAQAVRAGIERFDPERYDEDRVRMEAWPDGGYVRFDDHDAKQRAAEGRVAAMREALEMAIKQNSHDMLMTGDEIRKCTAALATNQDTPA